MKKDADVLLHDGKEYYPVGYTLNYWLDDNDKELKERASALITYRVTGPFRPDIFKKAVAYLILRHESLRVTFHKIENDYYARVEDAESPQFQVECMDLRAEASLDIQNDDHPLHFPGHVFDLKTGPLFLVRLMQTKDDEFIISMKLHHAIYDGWSMDILIRDLQTCYFAFLEDMSPDLPALDRQLRHFMAIVNDLRKSNFESDKSFWDQLYPDLPGDLTIPGARVRDCPVDCRPAKEIRINMPEPMPQWLKKAAEKYSTNIYIILQSLLKMYIFRISGQNDLVFGMLGYGRVEIPGSENQIGCYCRAFLLRTVLNETDSFGEVVQKVKQSNLDLWNHKACSLLDAMGHKIPPKLGMQNTFWKIDLDYQDDKGYYVEDPGIEDQPGVQLRFQKMRRNKPAIIVHTELKIDFSISQKGSHMHVKYDSGVFDIGSIEQLMNGYLSFAEQQLRETMNYELRQPMK